MAGPITLINVCSVRMAVIACFFATVRSRAKRPFMVGILKILLLTSA